jgi:hypothetical protein
MDLILCYGFDEKSHFRPEFRARYNKVPLESVQCQVTWRGTLPDIELAHRTKQPSEGIYGPEYGHSGCGLKRV